MNNRFNFSKIVYRQTIFYAFYFNILSVKFKTILYIIYLYHRISGIGNQINTIYVYHCVCLIATRNINFRGLFA